MHGDKAQIQQAPVPAAEAAVAELPIRLGRKGKAPRGGEEPLNQGDHPFAGEAHDADGGDLGAGGDGGNGFRHEKTSDKKAGGHKGRPRCLSV